MNLTDRYWEISVGTTLIATSSSPAGTRPLTVEFEVAKSLDREPNRSTVKVTDLSPSTRERLEALDEPELNISAGYQDLGLRDTIFVGDCQDIYSTRDGANVVTTVESEDGGRSYRSARLSMSFPPGSSLATIISTIAGAMDVGIGNALAIAATATLPTGSATFLSGLSIEGPAWRSLDTVCRSANLRWSVQNGVLQLRRRRQPAEITTVLLSPSTGLIGSPARSSKDPRTGDISISAKSLLIPGIYPGKTLVIQSSTVTGNYMCHSVRYVGSTVTNDWYIEMELKDYDVV